MNADFVMKILTALIAVGALLVSYTALWASAKANRAQLFLGLRERFDRVYKGLPRDPLYTKECIDPSVEDYHNARWEPDVKDMEKFELMERYWRHTFDEWQAVKMLNQRLLPDLWSTFYAQAVAEGMKYRTLRYVLLRMITEHLTTFSGQWRDFLSDLSKAYVKDQCQKTGQKRKLGKLPTSEVEFLKEISNRFEMATNENGK